MSTSPSKPSSKVGPHQEPSTLAPPSSPQATRGLRRLQSHQTLSSNSPSLITQQRQQLQQQRNTSTGQKDGLQQNMQNLSMSTSTQSSRARANSDATLGSTLKPPSSVRKQAASHARKSSLENLLREGPFRGDIDTGLKEMRWLILSKRVEAEKDGMSLYRIYLWMALLNIPALPTDEYLKLVHRGQSPVYSKIRNDTFRTLATDTLFKRRVTDASLTRLLNAIAWKLHDAKKAQAPESSSASLSPTSETSLSMNESALYVQGMNVLCAPFLYAARSEVEAFALFHQFITQECPGYIRGAMDGVHKGLALVDKCLSIVEPKLSNYLLSKGLHAEIYAFPSVLTFCACTPPLPEVLHLWDFLFAYGPHLNILCIVAQLIMLKDQLLASPSPSKILRSFPPLLSKSIVEITVRIVNEVPDDVYNELVIHAR